MTNSLLTIHARHAIADLNYRYFWLIDNGQASKAASLFAPSACLTFGAKAPAPGTIEGSAIARAMEQREAQSAVTSRHVVSNLIIEENGEGGLKGSSILTLFRSEGGGREPVVSSVADVVDSYVQVAGDWKIQHREINPIFI